MSAKTDLTAESSTSATRREAAGATTNSDPAAQFQLASRLRRQKRFAAALVEIDKLVESDPDNLSYLSAKAGLMAQLGRYQPAIDIYRVLLRRAPTHARLWMSYGNALRTVARRAEGIAAYHRAIHLQPTLGEAWWSLANLKTYRFDTAEVDAMTAALARSDLTGDDRFHLHMALGKAQEDEQHYQAAFAHYASGNALRWARVRWDGEANHRHVLACERLFTEEFFAARAGSGCKARDPIFIVGLPRAGSTLIEQILASHSQVEGTRELPEITEIAKRLGAGTPGDQPERYLKTLAALSPTELQAIGQNYLDRTRVYRSLGRLRFIDKMPNNFNFIAMISLVLPNASIIDARRGPMASCFAAWKQNFLEGQNFTYDLKEIGRYYRDYVRLMQLYERVLPGKVLRVRYEDLVTETEAQVRRILDHCGLPFEPACLAHHENTRPVRTASSEQVRQPIYTDGLDQWRRFEPWLGDLRAELSTVLDHDA